MKISFDLDDTLFVNPNIIETEEPIGFPYNLKYKERLRKGSIELINTLTSRNHQVYIYTTSYREVSYIKGYFKRYGIKIQSQNIINGTRHDQEVQKGKKEILPSKMPSKYGIDLHIDDDISVKQNGQTYGFKVVLIKEQDDLWVEKILSQVT